MRIRCDQATCSVKRIMAICRNSSSACPQIEMAGRSVDGIGPIDISQQIFVELAFQGKSVKIGLVRRIRACRCILRGISARGDSVGVVVLAGVAGGSESMGPAHMDAEIMRQVLARYEPCAHPLALVLELQVTWNIARHRFPNAPYGGL